MSENPHIYPFKRRQGEAAVLSADILTRAGNAMMSIPWYMFGLALAGFLLARAQVLGGLYPFGPAFLASVAVVHKKQGLVFLLPLLLGVYSTMQGQEAVIYSAIYILLAVIFFLYNVDSRKQWVVVPSLVLAAVAVSKGLVLSLGEFSNYLLLVSIFESIFAGGLSMVFLVVLGAMGRFDISRHFSADEIVCFFVLFVGLISGCAGWQIRGLDVQDMASRFLIMVAAYLGGGGAGAACGALIGIVPSLSAIVAPSSIATYAFSGLLAGVFGPFGRLGSIMGFLLGNLILALYLLDSGQISGSLGASAAAAIIFFLLPQKFYQGLKKSFSAAGLKSAKEEKSERLLRLSVRRMRNAGWIFRDLSRSLEDILKEDEDQDVDNTKVVLNQLCHQLCQDCSLKSVCWEMDYSQTYRGVLRLFAAVEDHGNANLKDVPENFSKRCPHLKELLAIVNCLYELYVRSNYWQVQRQNTRKLLSRQLSGVSEVLANIAKEVSDFGSERELLEREFAHAIAKRGFAVENAGITSFGTKYMDVWAEFSQCPGEIRCRQLVEEEISHILNKDYLVHDLCCDGGVCSERCRYRLLAKGARHISFGKAQLAKDDGICGDCGATLLLEDGRQLLMVSDGMGVGRKASIESGTALSLVSRLLEAGFCKETTIDTVNATLALRAKQESFVTLDLCLVDLYSGEIEFVKTGGAPSFLKRGSQVKVIKGSSLPVGMLTNVESEKISERAVNGDLIILTSDGVLEGDVVKDTQWLVRILEQAPESTAQGLSEYLLEKVIALNGGRLKDDITIMVAKIDAA